MRSWINIFEGKHYIGSCVNSFDEDGDCIIDELPFSTVSDLAVAEENAKVINKNAFDETVTVPESIEHLTVGHEISYLVHDEVYMLYDLDSDIHYFFV
jgi:hypothetical protein